MILEIFTVPPVPQVFLSGASSGIGAATAQLFSRLGAALAITGRNAENLQAVADKCSKESEKSPLIIQGDPTYCEG